MVGGGPCGVQIEEKVKREVGKLDRNLTVEYKTNTTVLCPYTVWKQLEKRYEMR